MKVLKILAILGLLTLSYMSGYNQGFNTGWGSSLNNSPQCLRR